MLFCIYTILDISNTIVGLSGDFYRSVFSNKEMLDVATKIKYVHVMLFVIL